MKFIAVMMIFMYVLIYSRESKSFKKKRIIITKKRFCKNYLNNNHNYNCKFDNLRYVITDSYDDPHHHVDILSNNNNILNSMMFTSWRRIMNVKMFISLSIVMMSIFFNPTNSYAGI